MLYRSLLTIFIGVVLLFSCKNDKNQAEMEYEGLDKITLEIDSITVLYHNTIFGSKQSPEMRGRVEATIPDYTNPHPGRGIFPVTITDPTVLKLIQREFATLTPVEKYFYPDARILMDVHYKDGSVEEVDFCGPFSQEIFINGIHYSYNNRLAYIVKNNIGLYAWIQNEPTFKMMPEIKDTTIIKEPIIEGYWYKEYLKHKVILE